MNIEILQNLISKGYSTWDLSKELNTTQPNIRYWLKKYNLKTNKTILKEEFKKFCPCCKNIKDKNEFYESKARKRSSLCKECLSKTNIEIRNNVKELSVKYLGGECSKCGYNKCNAALEFHHLDPSQKDPKYSNLRLKFNDKLRKELDKCVLLCANCHREEHYLS